MKQKRLLSLDAFRGFTMAAMILVNFPGNWNEVYAPLLHSDWWGITFTDLIAPFFLFTIGVSIALSYGNQLDSGEKPQTMYKKILIRALKIFAVGMFLNLIGVINNFNWENIRWTGTLHRIAIVFLVCALIFLHTGWITQVFLGIIILVLYCIVMTCIPTPGYGKVMLEPGINIAAWIDQQYLPGKMWNGNWDPEGILSTFPSFVSGMSGMLVGKLLLTKQALETKLNYLFFGGFISFIIGLIWSMIFDLNENIWSSSFVLFTSGLAALTMASSIYVIDLYNYQKWAKVGVIFGMNAITVYVFADLLAIVFYQIPFGGQSLNVSFFKTLTSASLPPKMASMFYGIFFIGINLILPYILFKKKIFLKL